MNFVGHIHLARLQQARFDPAQPAGFGDRPAPHADPAAPFEQQASRFLLGSALPDLAAMGKFRLVERPSDEAMRAGVELHHRTDDAFHRHRWFRHNSQTVSRTLEEAGLGRGAAKACGHVGVELLLDGWLLDQHRDLSATVEQTTASVDRPHLQLSRLVEEDHRSRWVDHLASVAGWPLPTDYRSPDAVAARLKRILARRPRLAFGAGDVHLVSRTLGRQQQELEAGSMELIAELDQSLSA